VWLAFKAVPGIHIDGFWTLAAAALLVSLSSSLLTYEKKK
jgi:uncharacterized membrane protein YvlD (DUF360 family)